MQENRAICETVRLADRQETRPMRRKLTVLKVRRSAVFPTRGTLTAGGVAYPCVLGRSGIVVSKREGDGGTPRGRLPLRGVLQRRGRGPRLPSAVPARFTRRDEAWCDDMSDRRYNRPIRRPDHDGEERLWRTDRLYDVVIPLGWNDGPVVKGRGSAIFWHVCRPERSPTAGCVATDAAVFRKLLPRLSRRAVMVIG
jgi:L,D-peptidoglycan transpeptidase YkuD (ErfK/YbiS/YcfS/YnhG family)